MHCAIMFYFQHEGNMKGNDELPGAPLVKPHKNKNPFPFILPVELFSLIIAIYDLHLEVTHEHCIYRS